MKKPWGHILSNNILLSLILIIFLVAGCSPMLRYKTESFFFDGVPDFSQRVIITSNDTLSKIDSIRNKALAIKAEAPKIYFHPPYRDKKCSRCHPENGGLPLLKLPELCYTCHENWGNIFKTLHGPVAAGYCLQCHNQHFAQFPKLLIRKGQQLCLYCHNRKQVFQNIVHEHVGERNCTDCHSPHGGENRGMLRPGSCYNCHADFNKKYKVLHGPVASGYCLQCHASHETKTRKHLLRESQQICFYCHNQKQVLKNVVHKDIGKSDCTKCHNPHGGEDRFILIEALRPNKTEPLIKTTTDSLSSLKASTIIEKDSVFNKAVVQAEGHLSDSTQIKRNVDSTQIIIPANIAGKDSTLMKPVNPIGSAVSDSTKGKSVVDSAKIIKPRNSAGKDSALIKPVIPIGSDASNNTKEKSVADSVKTLKPMNNAGKDSALMKPVNPIDSGVSDNTKRKSVVDSVKIKKPVSNAGKDSALIKPVIDNTKEKSVVDSVKIIKPVNNAGKDSALIKPVIPIGSDASNNTKEKSVADSLKTLKPMGNAEKNNAIIKSLNPIEVSNSVSVREKVILDSVFKNTDSIIEMKTEDGLYKYLNGSYISLEEAIKYRDELVKTGYKDAFVVAYKNSERVPISSVNNVKNKNINDRDTSKTAAGKNHIIFRVQVGAFVNKHPDDKDQKLKKITGLEFEQTIKSLNDSMKNSAITNHVNSIGKDTNFKIGSDETKPLIETNTDSLPKVRTSNSIEKDSILKNPIEPTELKFSDSTQTKRNADSVKIIKSANNAGKDSALIKPVNTLNIVNPDSTRERLAIDSLFKNADPIIEILTEDGLHKYLNGSYTTLQEAIKYRDELVKKGYKDAFVVAYKNGKRVPNSSMDSVKNININDRDISKNSALKNLILFRIQVGAFMSEHPADKDQLLKKIPDSKPVQPIKTLKAAKKNRVLTNQHVSPIRSKTSVNQKEKSIVNPVKTNIHGKNVRKNKKLTKPVSPLKKK